MVLWYHFAFFAISVALFGLGLSALVVHYTDKRLTDLPRALGLGALATAVALVCVDLAFINVTPDWFGGALGVFTTLTLKLFLLFALAALPFFFGGFVVSLALTRYATHAPKLYFWDLLGAALGALGTLVISSQLPAPQVLLFFATMACVAGLCFALPKGKRGVSASLLVAVAGLVMLGTVGSDWLTLRVAKGIDLTRAKPELSAGTRFPW